MAEIFKILGVAIVTAIAAILLKGTSPELSFITTIAGIIVILLLIFHSLKGVLNIFQIITSITGVENGLIKLLLKIVGVGYITEFGAGILNDFGSSSIADKVVLGGKISIVLLSLPILQGMLQLVAQFLQLV